MKIMICAGEASGDLHASHLATALRQAKPDISFVTIGGDLLHKATATAPVLHINKMAFMGFSEVLRNLGQIRRNFKIAKTTLLCELPDVLVLVDYPSFNLKLAKIAHKAGIRVIYYISPKLWAWKSWRIKSIKKYVDKVLCILPFEPKWYSDRGYPKAIYVGNPSVEEIEQLLSSADDKDTFCRRHKLRSNRPVLALLPGSRRGEIRCNLPVMDAVARQFPQYTIAVGTAPGLDEDFYRQYTKFALVKADTYGLLAHSHAAICTSGTMTLEAALARVPQVVTYRSNGSKIAYKIMEKILKVKYVSLPNLIIDAASLPEMLLHRCTPEAVSAELRQLTPAVSETRKAQLDAYDRMRQALSNKKAAKEATYQILER